MMMMVDDDDRGLWIMNGGSWIMDHGLFNKTVKHHNDYTGKDAI